MDLANSWYQVQHRALRAVGSTATSVWHRVMRSPKNVRDKAAIRAMFKSYDEVFEDDLRNVAAGHYSKELAMAFPYLEHLRAFPLALSESPRMLWRRWRNDFQHLPKDVDLSAFPEYYRRTFHWQPDGWFSERSARAYDVSVELLFWGAADVMRRMTLPHLNYLKDHERPRVLDVACGTGRFLSTLHAQLPHARLYGVDLSPHYIAEARRRVDPSVSLLVENAEALPLGDGSFDAVVSIFLFHELPKGARRNVLNEAHRVLAKGGRLIVMDSLQRKDADAKGLSAFHEWFPTAYHEPYYKGYMADDLAAAMRACGFELESSTCHGVAKVVVGRRR
jgi:ubiquinone/menaquinone biosynthesis C-methylase UbiE